VGKLSKDIEAELPYWLLVIDHNKSPKELDEYTMEEILIIHAILEMRRDYKQAEYGYELFKQEKIKR
jgi:hypothetical protein